jgi:ubiquinone/menaquinone biosynthesis C-methylase UbiE
MCAWYEQSFGEDYLLVYKHRDLKGAYQEVRQMIDWLHLDPGAKVLDLCCGMGRHSLALTDFGYKVTGVDLSEILLSEAKKLDQDRKVNWLRGDMRQVPLREQFDAVVNLFTSFGYFETDEENAKMFLEMDRLLKTRGKFIIDFLNPTYVVHHLVPYSERAEGDTIIEERRTADSEFVSKRIIIKGPSGEERHYTERVKLYRFGDFISMMRGTQLQIEHVYGDYDASSYDEQRSRRLILVGIKKELAPK